MIVLQVSLVIHQSQGGGKYLFAKNGCLISIEPKSAKKDLFNEFWVRITQRVLKQFFEDLVESKTFVLEFVEMEKQLVKLFTKPLEFTKFDYFREILGNLFIWILHIFLLAWPNFASNNFVYSCYGMI